MLIPRTEPAITNVLDKSSPPQTPVQIAHEPSDSSDAANAAATTFTATTETGESLDTGVASMTSTSKASSTPIVNTSAKVENFTLLQKAPVYIKAIMNAEDKSFPRLECPAPTSNRYKYLSIAETRKSGDRPLPKYFFALDLHQCADKLPRLIGSIVETMHFLGPRNCVLSIVEGRSDDGTYEILKLLQADIEKIGAGYFLNSSIINPKKGNRVKLLAELRNQALNPLVQHPDLYANDTTVIFLNDVSPCMEDILELIHQRLYQAADMACGMDWTYVGADPTFYDVWIARDMNGDTFFNIPADGNWNSAWNLFWNNPNAQTRYHSQKPFQTFSCWNGGAAFTAKPLLEQKIRFRDAYPGECYQGEPELFCKDMWHIGYGKIAVVPNVHLAYSDEDAKKIKELKGYVSGSAHPEGDDQDPAMKIEWEVAPPPLVKCIKGGYETQVWLAWNESLTEGKPLGRIVQNYDHVEG
jgi:alpha-1,3-mannosyltransferase